MLDKKLIILHFRVKPEDEIATPRYGCSAALILTASNRRFIELISLGSEEYKSCLLVIDLLCFLVLHRSLLLALETVKFFYLATLPLNQMICQETA